MTVCVVCALIRASYKKQRSFVIGNCVCACVQLHTLESFFFLVLLFVWLCGCVTFFPCVLELFGRFPVSSVHYETMESCYNDHTQLI